MFTHFANFFQRSRKSSECGDLLDDIGRLPVTAQRRFHSRQSQLAATERALQMIAVHPGDQLFFADDQPRLRAAEDFVAAKCHDVGARLDSFRYDWFLRQSIFAQIDKGPAAEIFHYWQMVLFTDGDELLERYFSGKTDHFVIARM